MKILRLFLFFIFLTSCTASEDKNPSIKISAKDFVTDSRKMIIVSHAVKDRFIAFVTDELTVKKVYSSTDITSNKIYITIDKVAKKEVAWNTLLFIDQNNKVKIIEKHIDSKTGKNLQLLIKKFKKKAKGLKREPQQSDKNTK